MGIYTLVAILGLMSALAAISYVCANAASQARAWRRIAEERRWRHDAVRDCQAPGWRP